MKRLLLFAVAVVAIAVCVTGCKMSTSDKDTCLHVDSIGYDSLAGTNIKCAIAIDYPQGDDSLANGIKQFIARELATMYLPYINDEDLTDSVKYPTYEGDAYEGQLLVNYYGNGTMRYLLDLRKDAEEAYTNTPEREMPPLSYQLKISKTDTTSTYITYCAEDDYYLGGAHHSTSRYSRNISTKTYKPVDNMIDPTQLQALQPILRKYLLQCLKASGVEAVTEATLGDYLILPDDGLIPQPAHSPWLEKDSLCFIYQPYEIASYAVGIISFKMAVKDLLPYLSQEAKELVGQ